MDNFIMLRFFYCLSIVILILGVTKTNARNIHSEASRHNVTHSTSAYNQSKAEEMCNKYISQFCKTPIPTSNSTSNSTEIVDNTNGIIGGRSANPKEYPHMALIGITRFRKTIWTCGGSLISENFVLTAAHCAESKQINTIRLGELNLKTTRDDARTVDYSITSIIVHPEYSNASYKNDIALLKFERLTSFSDYIRPVCLNTLNEIPNQKYTAVGWGKTSEKGRKMSDQLRSVELDPENNRKCKSEYHDFNGDTMLCAGYSAGGKDTCQGDSGGPLEIENKKPECPEVPIYTQFGITSYGEGCARPDTPGVYTKVSHFIPWIESIVWK